MIEQDALSVELRYLVPSEDKPVYYASEGGREAQLRMSGRFEMRGVSIDDARKRIDGDFALDREGFTLVDHVSSAINLHDEKEIRERYLPESEALVARVTGAGKVAAFDYTLRSDDADIRGDRKAREPSAVVHNDYTARSGPQRLREILGASEAELLLRKRFAIINVWRSIGNSVLTTPLAVCDARSVMPEDLVTVERRAKDRIGELLMATYSPNHRWYYFDRMRPDEALLIKTFDSADDARARACIHTAFRMPNVPPNAPPRESIEVRTFAFFE